MAGLRSIVARIVAIFRRRGLDERIEEELRFHVEMETEENIRRGMSPTEARRQALLSSGGLEQSKELHRDARGLPFLESVFQDLRFAFRSFSKTPGFTATVLVTLTLGIGVGTAIFSIVNAILLKPLPYRDPDRVVMLWGYSDDFSLDRARKTGSSMSGAEFLYREQHSRALENITACRTWYAAFATERGDEDLIGFGVSEGFFDVLGVEPMLGRRFVPEEYTAGRNDVVILQHQTWKTRFGGEPNIVGKQFVIERRQTTVVGVMPPKFVVYSRDVDFLSPLDFAVQMEGPRKFMPQLSVIARLKEKASVEQAQTEALALAKEIAREYPNLKNQNRRFRVVPISEDATGNLRPALAVLFGAVLAVMLIVCSNVANLLLGRALFRAREMAVRAAIGAGQRRLARQLLTESLVLSLVGGAAGFGLAHIIAGHFLVFVPESGWGRLLVHADGIRVDSTAAFFAAGITIAAGILFGVLPALHASKSDLCTSLKDGASGSSGSRQVISARNVLVVVETALAVVLVCCAGLLIRSFIGLYEEGPGFRTEKRLSMFVNLRNVVDENRQEELIREMGRQKYYLSIRVAAHARLEHIRERVASLPGVREAALNSQPTMTNRYYGSRLWAYQNGNPLEKPCEIVIREVSENYLDLMGIRLLEGRSFNAYDRLESPRVMVVSKQAARECWPGEAPIDSQVQLRGDQPKGADTRVVGIVGDVRDDGIDKDPVPVVYLPLTQNPRFYSYLIVHAETDPSSVAASIQEAVREIDAGARPTAYYDVQTLKGLVRDSAWRLNYSTMMLGALGGISLLLAAVGVYGVLSQAVRQRTREIGLRKALGAGKLQITWLVIRQGMGVVAVGVAIGILASSGVTRFLGGLLFGVEPLDLPTFFLVPLVLFAAAFLACYLPATQAARVDPMTALRYE